MYYSEVDLYKSDFINSIINDDYSDLHFWIVLFFCLLKFKISV